LTDSISTQSGVLQWTDQPSGLSFERHSQCLAQRIASRAKLSGRPRRHGLNHSAELAISSSHQPVRAISMRVRIGTNDQE